MSGQTLTDRIAAAQYQLTGSDMARAVCKATTHEVMAPKKKHLECKCSPSSISPTAWSGFTVVLPTLVCCTQMPSVHSHHHDQSFLNSLSLKGCGGHNELMWLLVMTPLVTLCVSPPVKLMETQ